MANGETESKQVAVGEVAGLLGERAWGDLAERLGFATVEGAEGRGVSLPGSALDAWGVPAGVAGRADELRILADGPGSRLVLVEGIDSYTDFRRAILAAHRHNAAECIVWWLVGSDQITMAVADRRPDGRRFVRRIETDLDDPDPVGLRQWAELGADDIADADVIDRGQALRRHVADILRQEGLTREFFDGFRDALEALTARMESGPVDDEARHDLALATLLRLVFTYFLQERGALAEDRRFLLRHLRRARSDGDNFYRDVLRPFFFGALNCTPDQRDTAAQSLGHLPFLNGGLFEPIPAERDHPDLTWPNAVWRTVIEELLERFHFTVDEGVGADECRAVDPEMLGKVFEGLMYGERRHSSGSFYTPRDIVRDIVVGALASQLAESAEVDRQRLVAIMEGRTTDLPDPAADRVADTLASFHLLDPAVGTGAFLLEAERSLEQVYRACGASADFTSRYELRRAIVHRHLFGVDLQRTAVRICELRLWLSLMTAMPDWPIAEIPPLPNLAHRVACGNSLLSPDDRRQLRAGGLGQGSAAMRQTDRVDGERRRQMRRVQDEFLVAHGPEKARLRARLEELQTAVERQLLEGRLERLDRKLAPYENLAESRDLFGDEVELTDEQARRRERLTETRRAVDDALEDLESGRTRQRGFDYATRFGPLLDGGFDVVVTNPPWIRANRIDRSQRDLLKERYASFTSEMWSGADEQGIRVPFGAQVDAAALFVERALELLKPGGRLAALVPSKLFRSLHGTGIRRLMARQQLESVTDYSDGDRSLFDATVYPAVLRLQATDQAGEDASVDASPPSRRRRAESRRQPRSFCADTLDVSIWRGDRTETWSTEAPSLPAVGRDPGEPWLFAPPAVGRIFGKMRQHSRPLGTFDALQPSRGAMTGRNRAFVHSRDDLTELLGTQEAVEEWSRPVIGGRDIRERAVDPSGRLLWAYDDRLDPRDDLPDRLRDYFEEHAEALRSRSDYRGSGPLWQLFRLKPGLLKPKVVWRDLAPKLEAAVAPATVVPLNTVYFIALPERRSAEAVTALLNSEPLRAFAHALGERARGGWRRHFAWVMRLLPIPERLGTDPAAGSLPSPDEADSWASDLYGLSGAEVDRLRDWRTDVDEPEQRGAA